MPLPKAIPRFLPGNRMLDGNDCQALAELQSSVQDNVTAFATGGKANATQLNSANVNVTTVANSADSVLLPLAVAGMQVAIRNSGANPMQVFGAGTDTINAVATGTGVSQTNGLSALYFCTQSAPAGRWFRNLSA